MSDAEASTAPALKPERIDPTAGTVRQGGEEFRTVNGFFAGLKDDGRLAIGHAHPLATAPLLDILLSTARNWSREERTRVLVNPARIQAELQETV